jgi:hypothetical protein
MPKFFSSARREGRFGASRRAFLKKRKTSLQKVAIISKGRSAVDDTLFLFMRDYRHTVLNGGGGGLGDS